MFQRDRLFETPKCFKGTGFLKHLLLSIKDMRKSVGLVRKKIVPILLIVMMTMASLSACSIFDSGSESRTTSETLSASQHSAEDSAESVGSEEEAGNDKVAATVSLTEIPDWSGEASIEVNNNEPEFKDTEIKDEDYEKLSAKDGQGRCGQALACISEESMPEGERGSIGMIKPSGWRIKKYDFIDGKYLYNRCHLIGWQLTGDNDEENLITGTRYMNTEGMLPYENKVAAYLRRTDNHVMYKVAPIYEGDEPIARGVHMQAMSVEDEGKGLSFNVYCYNVQPAVNINYETGQSEQGDMDELELAGIANFAEREQLGTDSESSSSDEGSLPNRNSNSKSNTDETHYILNTNTKKFHYEGCHGASQIKNKNRQDFTGSREELLNKGYSPCGMCHP